MRGRVWIVLALALIISGSALAQSAIVGHVYSERRQPVANAVVVLEGHNGYTERVVTDREGGFVFDNLRAGAYRITAIKRPYGADRVSLRVPANQRVPVRLVLQRRNGEQ